MPGKRKRGGGRPGKKKKRGGDGLDLGDIASDEFDQALHEVSDDDADIMYNQAGGGHDDDAAIDPRFAHRQEGQDIDAFLGDVDKEEGHLAVEEQRQRAGRLTEDDFGLSELLPAEAKGAARKRRRAAPAKRARDYSGDLDALQNFLTQQGDRGAAAEQVEKDYSALSADEKRRMLDRDAPEIAPMLREFEEKLAHASGVLAPVVERVRRGELPTGEGAGFVELKLQLFLTYLMHVCFYLLLKAEGKPIQNNPVVAKLVELRAYLDRLKPIEKRLQHQIAHLLSRAAAAEPDGAGGVAAAPGGEEGAGRADLSALAAAAEPAAAGGLYRAAKTARAAADPDRRKRQEKLLALHQKQVAAAEEAGLARGPQTRSAAKMLKRAQRAGVATLDDSKGDAAMDPGLKGTLLDPAGGGSIMARVKRRQEQRLSRRVGGGSEEGGDSDDADGDDADDDGDGDDEEEEDGGGGAEELKQFYQDEIARRVEEKRRKKRKAKADKEGLEKAPGRDRLGQNQEGEVIDGHRKISNEITTNRGLVAKRPRKFKNPRVRSKHRAHKQEVRRRSQVKNVVKPVKSYQGERQIRIDVVRSHKMRN